MFYEFDTKLNHYGITDTKYKGRVARVLYSGNKEAAQSGVAFDDDPDLLFDYNQRFLELIRGLQPKSILILGGGAFTLPTALMNEFPKLSIVVIELDGELIDIAKKYFEFKLDSRIKVFVGDARHFIDENVQKFDAVLVDVFMHTSIPESLCSFEAMQSLCRCINKKGIVAFNLIASTKGSGTASLIDLKKVLNSSFSDVQIYPAGYGISPWILQNYVVTAQNNSRDLGSYLRYPSLKVSE